jgi:hypothetical protein
MSPDHVQLLSTAYGVLEPSDEFVLAAPLPSVMSLLQDFARRAIDPESEIQNALAGDLSGVQAYHQHQYFSSQVVAPLREMTSLERIVLALIVADYCDNHDSTIGLEPVLAAVTNGIWCTVPDQIAAVFASRFKRAVVSSPFAARYGVSLYDPVSHTVSHVSQNTVAVADVHASLDDDWRNKLKRAAEKANITPIPAISVDDIRDAISKIGTQTGPFDDGNDDEKSWNERWKERIEKEIGHHGEWDGLSIDDYKAAAYDDLGGDGKMDPSSWDIPGLKHGNSLGRFGTVGSFGHHKDPVARAEAYLDDPSGERGPLTKADFDKRGYVSEGSSKSNMGSTLFTAGIGLVFTVAVGAATGGVGLFAAVALGFTGGATAATGKNMMEEAEKAEKEKAQAEPKTPAQPTVIIIVNVKPKGMEDPHKDPPITAENVNKKWLDKQLKIFKKTGGTFSPASDGPGQWRPVEDDFMNMNWTEVAFRPVDPLDDPPKMLLAEERPSTGEIDPEKIRKLKAMFLERKIYRLESGATLPMSPIVTSQGYVLP